MPVIQKLGEYKNNNLWMMREDLIPFSFGGNKARKAELFFQEIDRRGYDYIVTYGSGSSNHCRVVANECCRRGLRCCIISPEETSEKTFNSQMMEIFGAEIITTPLDQVHDTIELKMAELKDSGYDPFFIEGGGHGNTGTEAYVRCYREIREYEKDEGLHFDHIFFASGTGTTQAGLVCGQLLSGDERKIIGISIARKNPRGRNVVVSSIRSYLGEQAAEEDIQAATVFVDDYTSSGYGKEDNAIAETIKSVLKNYGIPLDATYTGKAFCGMNKYIEKERIENENILFIHTGGTPLFFDTLRKQREEI